MRTVLIDCSFFMVYKPKNPKQKGDNNMCKCDFCDNSKGSRACRTYGGCYWAVQAMIEYKKQLKETHTYNHNYNHNYNHSRSRKRY